MGFLRTQLFLLLWVLLDLNNLRQVFSFGRFVLRFGVPLNNMIKDVPIEENKHQTQPGEQVADLDEGASLRVPAFDYIEEES